MGQNGHCETFPICGKILKGLGNKIITDLCEGCPHWHEEDWKKPSINDVIDAIITIQDWLQDEDGKACLIEKNEATFFQKSEYEK